MTRAAVSDSKPADRSGGYDPARRRRGARAGRERGCWVYIPAAELRKAGVDVDAGRPPDYRVWGGPRGGVVVSFYDPEPAP